MGHGLQMWLQIVWFLARAPRNATVVLDEPDVYMHPDLQRRLLTLVRSRFSQLLIATHSLEIIADVDPRAILAVDRRFPESEFVASLPGLQEVMDRLGAVQNIQLTRLMSAENFLLVEGADVKLLRVLQGVAGLTGSPIDLVPHVEIGGRGGWRSGVADRLPTKNADGEKIRPFAILDSDYFPPEEHAERYAEARQWGVQLRIWSRKEIENFLLVPEAIARLINDRAQGSDCTPDLVTSEIDRIVESFRYEPIEDSVVTILHNRDKAGGLPKALKAGRKLVAGHWKDRDQCWGIAPGKLVLSRLSAWSQERYGVGFGPEQIARSLRPEEVDQEVVEVISAVTEGRPLRRPFQVPASP